MHDINEEHEHEEEDFEIIDTYEANLNAAANITAAAASPRCPSGVTGSGPVT